LDLVRAGVFIPDDLKRSSQQSVESVSRLGVERVYLHTESPSGIAESFRQPYHAGLSDLGFILTEYQLKHGSDFFRLISAAHYVSQFFQQGSSGLDGAKILKQLGQERSGAMVR